MCKASRSSHSFAAAVLFGATVLPRSADEVCSLLASLGSASSCVFFSQVIISHARPGRRGSSRNKTSPRLLKRSDATFGFDGGDDLLTLVMERERIACAAQGGRGSTRWKGGAGREGAHEEPWYRRRRLFVCSFEVCKNTILPLMWQRRGI